MFDISYWILSWFIDCDLVGSFDGRCNEKPYYLGFSRCVRMDGSQSGSVRELPLRKYVELL